MKVYFEDRYERLREIADVNTKPEAFKAIAAFLDAHNYKSYYTRTWIEETKGKVYITCDVGSHTEFFKIEFPNREAASKFLQS